MEHARLGETWVLEELAWAELVHTFLIAIASARAWSQSMFSCLMPQLVAGALHPNPDVAQGTCAIMGRLTEAVLEAEKQASENPDLKRCLADMAWNQLQLARELMKIGMVPESNTVHAVFD